MMFIYWTNSPKFLTFDSIKAYHTAFLMAGHIPGITLVSINVLAIRQTDT